ncbi:MazG-like family protein [Sporomusa sphaeroides]|uniref:MazG-like family protein n=2 Tax=Sporomusa TaxID=2375 RepID=A0ABM9W185_9FIRM|nr:MazG-like family protein [Sporomusa sphaeroides]OLS56445.1 MazG-like family protein [Sporomusa sphaeroides DSM 2875]CVK18540.1 MazG-like family protein [Sporomusa sphaeroides DSM 2875]SCM82329.1 MazG-like family [uncultured Sporomusa sp.]HML35512.1 MazG-like family protein [Sporomusa sphaeroides]
MFSQESDILRKLRLIEGLKADLLTEVGKLYQAMARNKREAIGEALAQIIISAFVLGRRLGIDYPQMDELINNRLGTNINQEPEIERWFGDMSEYRRHLRQKR